MSATGELRAAESAAADAAPARVDRRAFLLASIAILWVIVVARRLVNPADPVAWSYQALTLCLVVAAIAGRSLVGRGSLRIAATRDLTWPPAAIWSAIILAAILPYLQSLTVGFMSDDFGLAASAREARSALDAMRSTAFVTFYRPFVLLVWWLADRLWHGAPLGFHLLAVLLHAANSLLVYAIGRRLIGSNYGGLAAALLFAVHPLHVEPVSWPAAASDLLCAAFSLLSLLAVHAYAQAGPGRSRPLLLAGALAAFVVALLSKEVALALPGAVVLMLAVREGGVDVGAGVGSGFVKPAAPDRPEPLPDRPWRLRISSEVVTLGGAYAAVLAAYIGWRAHVLGGLGGYALPRTFWNTIFPSNPLLLMGDFLFPIHVTLLAGLRWWAWWLVALAMALGVFWWLAGLDRVPARRLWLWVGFVFVLAIPSWTFRWQPSASLEWSRFAYLPTIGLAWLFGDLCAGRGMGWRRSGAAVLCTIVGCVALTVWYIVPWRQAGAEARQALSAGVALIHELGAAEEPPTLFVRGLPEAYQGAPVFANCYPQAIDLAMGQYIPVRVVAATRGAVHPDVMAAWRLQPGEYLVAFDADAGRMRIVRSGRPTKGQAPGEEER